MAFEKINDDNRGFEFFFTYDPKEQNLNVANKKRWWTKSYLITKETNAFIL